MEGSRRRGLLAPSALPGKAAAGGGRKPPACHEDNVLGGHAVEATSFAPAQPEVYRKVFGAASACSIPALDLPSASDGCGCLGFSALDYLDIFGGLDGRDFGVPYQELFFDPTEESTGAGAPPSPLPAPDDTAPLSANTCISRRSKEMSHLTHEIPLPEWPGGDSSGSSLSRVVHHLSDGTKQTNLSDHTASWNSEDDPVHGTIHKNQVHAISRSTIFVEHTKSNIPDIQVVADICLYSSGSKETMKGQHLKKTVVSTSYSSTKHPQIDMKAEPRPPKSEFCASRIALYEQNESLISSNQSMVLRSNVASANLSNNHSLHEDFVEKKTERKWQNDTAQSTFTSMKSGNDLKVQCFASEHIPAKEALFSCSSSDHAASSSPELSSDHLNNHINLDIVEARIVEANHMSPSPSCASSQTSDYDNKVEEKQFNTMSKFLEMSLVNESYRSHITGNHLISSWCQSYPHAPFLTVSDVILRTQPSEGPPPSRLPPARSPQCSDLDVRRLSANCHSFSIATGAPFTTRSFMQAESDISPPSFVKGVNESSRAVSLVAPIKEAMELAQARVKTAKPSMKGNDNFQIGLKSGVSDGRSIDRGEDKAIQDNRRNREDIVVQLTQKDNDGKVNMFATEKMMRDFRVSRLAANFKEKERNCGPVDWSVRERPLEEVSEQALVLEETEKKMTFNREVDERSRGTE